ncbi:MAG: hypothetical protein L0Y43_11770 [Methylococcaceae bacterium]|nr:hypothetical protein [Methylococcaceae bacterium]
MAGQPRLKAYALGVQLFDRPATHDPQVDSIVRTAITRLRKMLNAYYAEEGRDEPIRIVLNKGSYLPVFTLVPDPAPGTSERFECILLAVERLKSIGGASELEYLSTGMSEELISRLSGYYENFIIVYAADVTDAQPCVSSASETPGLIGYLLRGTIRTDADEMRISFKLSECKSGAIYWAESFSARLSSSSLFDIQEQVACEVAATLLDPHGVIYRSFKRKPAEHLGTYLAVFRYHEYQERFTAETHLRARESLETAIGEEPDYADAWAAQANVYLGEALFGFNQASRLSSLAEKFLSTAQKAVALEPRNVMANYILAMTLFYRKGRAQFLAMAEHALSLAPSRPDNLAVIGMHLMLVGQWQRGLEMVEKAMKLNPYHPNWHYLALSLYHLHGRRYPEALNAIDRFAALDFFPFQMNLAVIHGYLGNQQEARKALARMFDLWPDAAHKMKEILDFWFPFEDLAEVFTEGLKKAGFSIEQEK